MAHRNFARGHAPPAHSWEWSGVALPPTTAGKHAAPKPAPGKAAPGAPPVAFVSVTETIVVKKKRPWLAIGIGGAVGFLLGYGTGRR